MAKPDPDEKPPTEEHKDEPPEPAPEPAEATAEEEGEKVPAWGKTLIDQVSSLTDAITGLAGAPAPEGAPEPDSTPQRKPWHRRGMD